MKILETILLLIKELSTSKEDESLVDSLMRERNKDLKERSMNARPKLPK